MGGHIIASPDNGVSSLLQETFSCESIRELEKIDAVDDDLLPWEPDGWNAPYEGFTKKHTHFWHEVIVPETPEQLVKYVDSLYLDNTIWRGHSRLGYRLDANIIRKYKTYDEEKVSEIERELLKSARKQGFGDYEGQTLSDLELLALIQHQGGSTRLLDFTQNMWVAIWFSCAYTPKDYDKNGILLGFRLRENFVSQNNVLLQQQGGSIEEILAREEHTKKVIFWKPPYFSPRMRIQESFFAFSRTHKELYGSLIEVPFFFPYDSPDIQTHQENNVIRIAIPPALKKELKKICETKGYNHLSLFPDLQGFAQHWSHDSTNL